jgi:addiction module RelE/StbE family toxin
VRVEWTDAATADRDAIYVYIDADSPRAAISLDERFREVTERLSRFPRLGRPGRVPNTREFVAHRNYIIVYEVDDDAVRILRVLHSARQWPPE